MKKKFILNPSLPLSLSSVIFYKSSILFFLTRLLHNFFLVLQYCLVDFYQILMTFFLE